MDNNNYTSNIKIRDIDTCVTVLLLYVKYKIFLMKEIPIGAITFNIRQNFPAVTKECFI